MAKAFRTINTGELERYFELDRAWLDESKRTVELSFSSEQPVKRWFGTEVLSHDAGAVDLSRLNNGAALLVEHDTRDFVGSVVSAVIGPDKKGRATVRFGKSARAEEIFQDVKNGDRRLVSVGYVINRMVAEGEADQHGNMDDEAVYRAVEWMPYEISLVAIPADTTVCVGRSDEQGQHKTIIEFSQNMKRNSPLFNSDPAGGNGPAPAAPSAPAAPAPIAAPAIVPSPSDIRKEETTRCRELIAIGTKFRKVDEANTAVENGTSVAEFRKQVMDTLANKPSDEQPAAPNGNRSFGEQFVTGEMYRGLLKSPGKSKTGSVEIAGYTRATGTTTGLTSIQKQPGIVLLNQQPLTIANILIETPTQNTTIRYIQETTYTNAATAVAEEGLKPEASWDLLEVDATVRKIAVVGRVTDEMFADYAQMQNYVNNRLQFMVESKEDNHLLNGTGNTNQIKGLLQFTGIQTQAVGSNTVPDAFHKAITKVRTVGFFEPDAVVIHPSDWEGIKLMKDNNGQYYGNGPLAGSYGNPGVSVERLWGLPVVATTAIAQGTALVGAFRLGAEIFRKLGLTVESTNSDASDFQYNRIAIRAETRLTLACYRPLAFCSVTSIA